MSHLQDFVADLLQREDVLVEPVEPDGLEVLAPPRVQRALRIPEFCRLGFGATMPPGAQRVGVESDWLDRFDSLIGDRGRCCRHVLAPGNRKPPDAEQLLLQELDLGNATYKLLDSSPAWTRCLILYFRFSALSDEKRDGVVRLGVNLATGAVLDESLLERLMPSPAGDQAGHDWPEAEMLPPSWDRQHLLEVIGPALSSRIAVLLEPFTRSLRRRLARDQERLYDYHNELQREAGRRLAALPAADDGRRREQQRIEAIGREYQAKLDDLGHKYALRVVVEWVQTLDLAMQVQRLKLLIRRRKGERIVHLDWHPAARQLEPLLAEFGYAAGRTRMVCDEALHLVGAAGLAACSGCGKPYCRACHRAGCPKCGAQEAGGSVASISSATA
jgi:hypothetical protein